MKSTLKHIIHKLTKPKSSQLKANLQMTLEEWVIYHQKHVHFNSKWMGAPAWKNPLDAWVYQEIIYEVKPDYVVEIGSAHGGSTLFLANILDIIGKGKVISIDIDRSKFKVKHKRIIAIKGDSCSKKVVTKVENEIKKGSVLVIQDGDHRQDGVTKDLESYCNIVTKGSYFIIEDSIVDLIKPPKDVSWLEGSGPTKAIQNFLASHNEYKIDHGWEKYILTYNPGGFLKKIK